MFSTIISAVIDGVLSAAVKWLQYIQQRREDVQHGKEQQHTADVEATVSEAKDNAEIREQVQAEPVSAAADDIDRLRHTYAPSGDH